MFTRKIIFIIFILQNVLIAFSQSNLSDTTFKLKEVVIIDNRLENFTTGNKIQKIAPSVIQDFYNENLADLLTQNSQLFIKSYGLGSMATTSFRGAGASHTAILWNGFNLQSPMNGQVDLALVPVAFIDNIQLQYGGSGALFGSGAVGGTIHLNNISEFNKGTGFELSKSYGSFKNHRQALNFQISKKKFISSVKLFHLQAKNDFRFINTAQYGNPEDTLENAELLQYGILQENHLKINSKQQVGVRLWYQFIDRQIPSSMTEGSNSSSQKDEFYRVTAEWQRTGDIVSFFARTGFFDNQIIYNNPEISINALSISKTSITEFESNINISQNHLLNIGLNNTYEQAVADNYRIAPDQNRTSIFASYKLHNNKYNWKSLCSIRQELIEGNATPFIPSLGFDGIVIKGLSVKGNISKNYRVPTFNDLFWEDSYSRGNPDLKPESGWSEEISLTNKSKFNSFKTEINVTGFNSNINNLIIWLPSDNSIWSPENVKSVWSRGLESSLTINLQLNKTQFQFNVMYNYVLSTNKKTGPGNEQTLEKQLIYVPVHNALCNLAIVYKGFFIRYNHTYTGKRFTTTDNADFLDDYFLGNLFFKKTITLGSIKFNLNAQINNVWNKDYQVMEFRAMPLRYFEVGISLKFNK